MTIMLTAMTKCIERDLSMSSRTVGLLTTSLAPAAVTTTTVRLCGVDIGAVDSTGHTKHLREVNRLSAKERSSNELVYHLSRFHHNHPHRLFPLPPNKPIASLHNPIVIVFNAPVLSTTG